MLYEENWQLTIFSLKKGEKPNPHLNLAAKIQSGVVGLGHDSRDYSGTHRHTPGQHTLLRQYECGLRLLYQHSLASNSGFKFCSLLTFKKKNVTTQGIAYAIVAGLPPQYGLYSAYLGCFVYCLLGRWCLWFWFEIVNNALDCNLNLSINGNFSVQKMWQSAQLL